MTSSQAQLTPADLLAAAEQLRGAAGAMADFVKSLENRSGTPHFRLDVAIPLITTNADTVEIARGILKHRRSRDGLFPKGWFGEAAWDIVLALYIAEHERRPVSVTSACYASAVPTSTALRWIQALVDEVWIIRQPHRFDGRVDHLMLAAGRREQLYNWLASCRGTAWGG